MSAPSLNVNLKPCGCAKWQDPVFPLHPSATYLAAYVERLVEQVGVLS